MGLIVTDMIYLCYVYTLDFRNLIEILCFQLVLTFIIKSFFSF